MISRPRKNVSTVHFYRQGWRREKEGQNKNTVVGYCLKLMNVKHGKKQIMKSQTFSHEKTKVKKKKKKVKEIWIQRGILPKFTVNYLTIQSSACARRECAKDGVWEQT